MTTETTNSSSRLANYLQSRLPDYPGPTRLEKFNAGQSNPTYLLQSGPSSYVLRRKPAGELLASAHAVDREFRLLVALHGSAVPVAKPWLLCRDESVIGSMFYIMSYEPGDIFWDPALPEVPRHQRQDYYHALIDTLASLHDIDYVALGLQDFGKPGNYYERQLTRWTAQYNASATREIPAMNQLITWLQQALPADDGQCSLIHGDYRLDNVIFHPGEARIKAVLDWELATLGHPLADLAYYCMALRLPGNDQIRGLGGQPRAAQGIPEEEALVERYCAARGLTRVAHWEFCMAFSFFRLAAILQGVYKRGLDGNASNERAIRMGGMVEPLAEMAIMSL